MLTHICKTLFYSLEYNSLVHKGFETALYIHSRSMTNMKSLKKCMKDLK